MKQPTKIFQTEAEWLEARQQGIGGSDASAAIGASHRKSPLELYAEKVGVAEESALKAARTELTWGRRLEPFIRESYMEETGRKVESKGFHQYVSTDNPFMTCTLDGTVWKVMTEVRPGVYEAKWTTHIPEKEILEEPPLDFQIQVQHNMAVTECEWASLAILVGYGKLLWLDIERNDKFIVALIAKERELWERIQNRDPPEPSEPYESSLRALKSLYPVGTGGITLPLVCIEFARQYEIAKSEKKIWEAKEDKMKAMLISAIGDYECGYLPGGVAYTYKTRKGYTVTEHAIKETRVLRKWEKGK